MLKVFTLEPDVSTCLLTEPERMLNRRLQDVIIDSLCGVESGLLNIHHL